MPRRLVLVGAAVVVFTAGVMWWTVAHQRGPTPSTPISPVSMIPDLPRGVSIADSRTWSTDSNGGVSVGVVLLRSTDVPLAQLDDEVARTFDSDPSWRERSADRAHREWSQGPDMCTTSRDQPTIQAELWITHDGERVWLDLYSPTGTIVPDSPALLIRITITYATGACDLS